MPSSFAWWARCIYWFWRKAGLSEVEFNYVNCQLFHLFIKKRVHVGSNSNWSTAQFMVLDISFVFLVIAASRACGRCDKLCHNAAVWSSASSCTGEMTVIANEYITAQLKTRQRKRRSELWPMEEKENIVWSWQALWSVRPMFLKNMYFVRDSNLRYPNYLGDWSAPSTMPLQHPGQLGWLSPGQLSPACFVNMPGWQQLSCPSEEGTSIRFGELKGKRQLNAQDPKVESNFAV